MNYFQRSTFNFQLLLVLVLAQVPAMAQTFKLDQKANEVAAPRVLTVTSTNVLTVFGTNLSVTAGRVLFRSIQNTGTNAFLYCMNSTNVASTNYHGVVSGGAALRDGLGSILDVSRVPWPVSLKCESGDTEVTVVELTQ